MQRLEALRDRLQSVEDLQAVVLTMKSLAAVHIRHYERAVRSLQEYAHAVELGFQIVLHREPEALRTWIPAPAGATAAVVFGSDQGMVGRFNAEIAWHAVQSLDHRGVKLEKRLFLVVGARLGPELEALGQSISGTAQLPSSVEGITACVREVLLQLEQWREQGSVSRIQLFHHHPLSGAAYEPRHVLLFPLDLGWLRSLRRRRWPTRMLPALGTDGVHVLAAVLRQFFFMALYRAFAESLAAENASRLASMQAAERNIEEALEKLRLDYHRRRQSDITEELLDVLSGFEVLKDRTR
jgi:F-type H+-transporting ATPase subunit gamma